MAHSLHGSIAVRPAINPQAVTANTAITGATIDRLGFRDLEFVIQSATLTDGTYTPKLIHGDAVGGDGTITAPADVPAANLRGTVAGATFAPAADDVTKRIGYAGGKRYVALVVTPSAVTTGGAIGALAILADHDVFPVP